MQTCKHILHYANPEVHEAAKQLAEQGYKVKIIPVTYRRRMPKFPLPGDPQSVLVKVDGEEYLVNVERNHRGELVAAPGPHILYRLEVV